MQDLMMMFNIGTLYGLLCGLFLSALIALYFWPVKKTHSRYWKDELK